MVKTAGQAKSKAVHKRELIPPHPARRWTFALICGASLLAYTGFHMESDTRTNIRWGLCSSALLCLLFAVFQYRDSSRKVWLTHRLVLTCGIMYAMALIFLLFQKVDDARLMMWGLDTELGKPLVEFDYAADCRVYTPEHPTNPISNIWRTMYDEYFVAHGVGWVAKGILMRDYTMCWVISILFEVWEMTFEFMITNFKECWWDHAILDVMMCNAMGIFVGMQVIKALKLPKFNWAGIKRATAKEPFKCEVLQSGKRFVFCFVIIAIMSVVELNAFFLKFALWIPPPHGINIFRLLMWCCIGFNGFVEMYAFITSTKTHLGTTAWLCIVNCALELLISVKFGRGLYPNPPPPEVVWGWGSFTVLMVSLATYLFVFPGSAQRKSSVKQA